jgi:hypothetical protein
MLQHTKILKFSDARKWKQSQLTHKLNTKQTLTNN